jgi:3-hydroxyacyl-CoA dehydrogenase
MPKVAVVGSGLIGRAWAVVFASHGWRVSLYDVSPGVADAARMQVEHALKELASHDLVADPNGALDLVEPSSTLAVALKGATLVQENGPEVLEIKRELFKEMDSLAGPDTILASSTSFIVASRFTEDLAGRHRCLVAHPVNPPHLVPVVELCPAPWTAPNVVERARTIYDSVGQVPVLVRNEVFGFVLNRLQAVLMAEAFRLVGEGVISPQDLDKTVRDGLGLRWAFMGPSRRSNSMHQAAFRITAPVMQPRSAHSSRAPLVRRPSGSKTSPLFCSRGRLHRTQRELINSPAGAMVDLLL